MKNLITLLILLISVVGYGQKIKGSLKDGGFQTGKPFFRTYDAVSTGKYNESSNGLIMSLPNDQRTIVFFNYEKKNQLKAVFENGKSSVLFNIHNVETEYSKYDGDNTTALVSHNDVPGGQARIKLNDDEFRIIFTETNDVIEFSMPVE